MIRKYLSIGDVSLKKLTLMYFLMLIAGILEVASIGLILPIFQFLVDGNFTDNTYVLKLINTKMFNFLSLYDDKFILIFLTSSIVLIFFIKNIYLVFFGYYQTVFILNIETKLSIKLYKNYIFSSIQKISGKFSSEIIRNVINQSALYAGNFIFTLLIISVELITFSLILIFLFLNYPFETLILFSIFIVMASIYFLYIKNKIFLLSSGIQKSTQERIKLLQEGFGAQKEIKIFNFENIFLKRYSLQSFKVMRNSKLVALFRILPRHCFELISIVLIVVFIIYKFNSNDEFSDILPQLGLFVLAGIRILPSINRTLNAFQRFKESMPIVINLYNEELQFSDIELKENVKKFDYKKYINLDKISFKYSKSNNHIFKDLNLNIEKGKSYFLCGGSGQGKSTLAEIISGLLVPDKGGIEVDGININNNIKGWQDNISYLPQSVYIFNASIKDNILFGEDEKHFRENDYNNALLSSNIYDLATKLGNNNVGDNGSKLSSGQIQRIGLARALYKKNTNLIIFDEITANLDKKNEEDIIQNIIKIKNGLTILFISHNMDLSENFDNVLEISNKSIKNIK